MLTAEQRNVIRIALGLNTQKQANRNSYTAATGTHSYWLWDSLVKAGMALMTREPSGLCPFASFAATRNGAESVLLSGEKFPSELIMK